MNQSKVLVINDNDSNTWAAPLMERLAQLDARATHLEEADIVAVVLHQVPNRPQHFTLNSPPQHPGLADIQKALLKPIPVTPILGGCRQLNNFCLQLPDAVNDLQFRIALALPGPLNVPGVAAQLIAAAMHARSPSLSKNQFPSTCRQKTATSAFALLSRAEPQHQKERVFISYRREDTTLWAGELAKALSVMLGPQQVFFDVGSDSPGMDFRNLINKAMAKSSIAAVVIGKNYFASNADGQRRIDNHNDWVHAELRAAIAQDKPLRVILVGSAVAPAPDNLPDDIRALADAKVVGTIRTGKEMSQILSDILSETQKGKILKKELAGPGGAMKGFSSNMAEAWTIAAVRDGLNTLGWLLETQKSQSPMQLFHPGYPDYRFVVISKKSIVALEEYTGKRWERRETFSINGAGMGHTGIMKLEPRLLEAAVHPGAYLDRTGRETLSPRKTEWPAGLDPLHYNPFEKQLLPITIEAWNDTRQYIISTGGLEQPPQRLDFRLKTGTPALAAFMACGNQIVTAKGENLEIIDISNSERRPFPHPSKRRYWRAMDVSRTGRLALGSADGVISIFDKNIEPCFNLSLPRKMIRKLTAKIKGSHLPNQISTLSWSSSERYIVAATGSDAWIVELKTKSFTPFAYPLPDKDLQLGHAGARFIGHTSDILIHAGMGDIWIINAQTNEVKGRLKPAWRPDSEWKNDDLSDSDLMRHALGTIRTAVPSPDGKRIALAGSNGQFAFTTPASVMGVESIYAWHQPTTHAENNIQAIAFHPNGKQLAVAASDAHLIIGDMNQKRPEVYATLDAPLAYTSPVITWAPDGKRVALIRIQHDKQLSVWTF